MSRVRDAIQSGGGQSIEAAEAVWTCRVAGTLHLGRTHALFASRSGEPQPTAAERFGGEESACPTDACAQVQVASSIALLSLA